MLLRITSTYQDGRTKLVLINDSTIKDINADDRPGSPSKSIIVTDTGFRYFAAETVEQLAAQLAGGK